LCTDIRTTATIEQLSLEHHQLTWFRGEDEGGRDKEEAEIEVHGEADGSTWSANKSRRVIEHGKDKTGFFFLETSDDDASSTLNFV
jgi:hypothetical protein